MRAARNWQKADFFRRIPKDLTEATTVGAVISIACVVVMVLLFAGEVISFVSPRIQSDMIISPDPGSESTIKATLDITFHKMPCAILTLDILDVLHNHVFNSMEHISKTRLDASGAPVTDGRPPTEFVDAREGCNLRGYIQVAKVPGNFHISSHGREQLLKQNFPTGINVEHTIHHMSFGSTDVKKLAKQAQLHPLDGKVQRSNVPMLYHYYLDIVPTIYEGTFSSSNTYQFTGTNSEIQVPAHVMPAVVFQYQLSPITVRYSAARASFSHFLTYVCAIVGGVFTVAGLLSRFVQTSAAQIQRRVLGKAD